ncbi:MAG: hypothetical protein AABX29_07620 [Nanoarchaeota archaeon]
MEEEVKKDILDVLKKSLEAIKKEDIVNLRELSNHTLHDASIYQDDYSTTIAIIIYSLSKVFERVSYREYKSWSMFYKNILEFFDKAIKALEEDNIEDYEVIVHDMFNTIYDLEPKLRDYIINVFQGARIHKASRLHEHGVSVGRVAEILGLSEFEIMDYLGKTGIADVEFSITRDVRERIKFVRGIFK